MVDGISIRLEKLTKIYKQYRQDIVGIQDVDLTINAGEILGLLGPNGAGKSTMLKVVATLLKKTSGKVLYGDMNPDEVKDRELQQVKRQIGYVSEIPFFYNKLSGREYLTFIGKIYEIDTPTVNERLDYYMDLFDLAKDQDRFLSTYSQGMLKKISIIAAFINDQQILILDEPANSLDPQNVSILKELIVENRNKGKTIILSTHLLDIAEIMSDRIAILNHGKLQLVEDISILDSMKRKGVYSRLEQLYLKITS